MKLFKISFVSTILLNICSMENPQIPPFLDLQFLVPNLIDDKCELLNYATYGTCIDKMLERSIKYNFEFLSLITKFQDKLSTIKKTLLEPESISYDFEIEDELVEKLGISLGSTFMHKFKLPLLFESKKSVRDIKLKFFNRNPLYLNFFFNKSLSGSFPEQKGYKVYNLKWQDEKNEQNKAAISFQISEKFNECPFFKEFKTTLLDLKLETGALYQELNMYIHELEPDSNNKMRSIFIICWAKQDWHLSCSPEFIMPIVIFREADLKTNRSKIKIFDFYNLREQLKVLISIKIN